ncbi:MAG: hypothetical protein ACE14P_14210 [Methanotrichaceae archaeon]
MVLCLRLATGKIRKYRTSYAGRGENPTYHTKCGIRWPNLPKEHEECSHLDCALAAAEQDIFDSLLFLVVSFLAIVWGGSRIIGMVFEDGKIILLVAFSSLILTIMAYALYQGSKQKNELIEFRDKCTIGGIKAERTGLTVDSEPKGNAYR